MSVSLSVFAGRERHLLFGEKKYPAQRFIKYKNQIRQKEILSINFVR